MVPDEQQVALLVREQAAELLCIILEMDAVDDGIRRGVDPRTGRMPKTEARRTKLLEFLLKEQLRLRSVHESALVAYADTFGGQSASELDEDLHTWVFGRHTRGALYSPGHPWFYLPQGDGRAPIPLDEIQPNPLLASTFNEKLPRQPAKREQRLRDLLKSELAGLEADKLRYQEIVLLGAEALSDYDRTIAYRNDEEAWAGSLALKYNHLCYRLSRILWLEEQLEQEAPEAGT